MTDSLIRKAKKCGWWHCHNWGKWRVTGESHITRSDDSVVGRNIVQKRECQDCGFTKTHCEKIWLI
jgi:hypothetical protein